MMGCKTQTNNPSSAAVGLLSIFALLFGGWYFACLSISYIMYETAYGWSIWVHFTGEGSWFKGKTRVHEFRGSRWTNFFVYSGISLVWQFEYENELKFRGFIAEFREITTSVKSWKITIAVRNVNICWVGLIDQSSSLFACQMGCTTTRD